MTLTLELTKEEEARLLRNAEASGLNPGEYAHMVLTKPTILDIIQSYSDDSMTVGDKIREIFGDRAVGNGTSRWSEVEVACDPH